MRIHCVCIDDIVVCSEKKNLLLYLYVVGDELCEPLLRLPILYRKQCRFVFFMTSWEMDCVNSSRLPVFVIPKTLSCNIFQLSGVRVV